MQYSTAPSQAAFPSTPHLRCGGAAVWYTAPHGAVVQLLEPMRVTVEVANWVVGPAYDELDRRYPGRSGLIYVLDLGLMTGRTPAARSVFLGKVREVSGRFSEAIVVQPRAASAASRESIRVAMMLVRALGLPVTTMDSAVSAVAARGLHALP